MIEFPKISIITATLNAGKVLEECYRSVSEQDYPKDKVELIIADGGSTDNTIEIANKYGAKILSNPLKTAEAGKVVAVKAATGEYLVLLDSDNILPNKNWLNEMIEPLLSNPDAVGSEPWSYTWRPEDGFITRYCALIGMNDPYVLFNGIYDRMCLLTGKWTEVPHEEIDKGNYLLVTFSKKGVPTIGANGTVFRAEFLRQHITGDYLFDIDIIGKELRETGKVVFIKVKNGIVHTYCENDILKFARKQRRRINDYIYHKAKGHRSVDWEESHTGGLLTFILYCVSIVPIVLQAFKGYFIKKDTAWFFHPLACEITFIEYTLGKVRGIFKKAELSRSTWRQ